MRFDIRAHVSKRELINMKKKNSNTFYTTRKKKKNVN